MENFVLLILFLFIIGTLYVVSKKIKRESLQDNTANIPNFIREVWDHTEDEEEEDVTWRSPFRLKRKR